MQNVDTSVDMLGGGSWAGATRTVNTLLRSLGSSRAALQLATESAIDATAAGLGTEAGSWHEFVLDSVLLHEVGTDKIPEMVVGAETLASALGTADATATRTALESARVRTGEQVFRIAKVKSESIGGVRYLYRLQLEG